MSNQRFGSEFKDEAESGTPVPALCREHGMSNASFYKWRAKFGGMYANERLKAEIVQEALA